MLRLHFNMIGLLFATVAAGVGAEALRDDPQVRAIREESAKQIAAMQSENWHMRAALNNARTAAYEPPLSYEERDVHRRQEEREQAEFRELAKERRLRAQTEAAELTKDCGFSNSLDFGSASITYGGSWADVQPPVKVEKTEKAPHYTLWGKAVADAFPSAWRQIFLADQSLAEIPMELSSSNKYNDIHFAFAVSHLIGLVETGFFNFAKFCSPKIEKPPTDESEWASFIEQVEKTIAQISPKQSNDDRKSPELAYYQSVMAEFHVILNLCQHSMLAAEQQDRQMALGIYEHTRSFMQLLAENVHEIVVLPSKGIVLPEGRYAAWLASLPEPPSGA